MTYFSSISRWKLFPALPSCINCSVKKVRKKVERELKGKTEMKFSMSDSLAHTSGKVQKKNLERLRRSSSTWPNFLRARRKRAKCFAKCSDEKKSFVRFLPKRIFLSEPKSRHFFMRVTNFAWIFIWLIPLFLTFYIVMKNVFVLTSYHLHPPTTMFYCLFIMGETSTPCEWWEHLRIL